MNIFRHIRNGIIFTASFSGVSFFYRMYQKRKGPLVRIVVFHDVADASWFRSVLMKMHERYHLISPQDFLESRFHPSRINILVTFDDGYSSWVDNCLSVLTETKTQALFFINSGLVEVSGNPSERERYIRDRLLISPRAILSWDGVVELQRNGHTIGGHTTTHTRLSLLQEREQRDEIMNDKKQIESRIGVALSTFAYPFGQEQDYTQVTKRILKDSGYVYAFTTVGTFADTRDSYTVSRLCIESDMTLPVMCRWIEGGYDIYQKIKRLCVR